MLTPAWTPLRYHREQSKLWRGTERFVCVCAGRGSGKTELARRRIVRFLPIKKPWQDPQYVYAMPTLGHGRRVAWEPLKQLIPREWIKDINESLMKVTTVFGSTLQVIGLDVPMRAEGLQYDGVVIDESSDQRPGVFDLTFRPALSHRRGWCWRIGVAKRRGQGAREYRRCFESWGELGGGLREAHAPEPTGKADGVHAAYTWPSSDILPADEVALHRDSMDEKDFNEQFMSSWESVAGLVYYCFDEVASVDASISYDSTLPLIVGSDFNVDPMAWVIMQERPGPAGQSRIDVIDEIWEHDTNTRETLDLLHQRYGHHRAGWHFFGDAAGRQRKTSASLTDYAHIRSDVRFHGAKTYYPEANPAVADRCAAVNAQLKSAAGTRRLFIHPRCLHLIRDLGYLSYKKGSREIDERDPDAKHITDALGYPLHVLRPVRASLNDDEGSLSGAEVGVGAA